MVDGGLLEMSGLVVVAVAEEIVVVVAVVIVAVGYTIIAVGVTFVATVHSVEEVVVDNNVWLVLLETDVVPAVIATFVVVIIVIVSVIRNVILAKSIVIAIMNVDQALAEAIDDHLEVSPVPVGRRKR